MARDPWYETFKLVLPSLVLLLSGYTNVFARCFDPLQMSNADSCCLPEEERINSGQRQVRSSQAGETLDASRQKLD